MTFTKALQHRSTTKAFSTKTCMSQTDSMWSILKWKSEILSNQKGKLGYSLLFRIIKKSLSSQSSMNLANVKHMSLNSQSVREQTNDPSSLYVSEDVDDGFDQDFGEE